MKGKHINKPCLSLRPPLPYATGFCFVAEKPFCPLFNTPSSCSRLAQPISRLHRPSRGNVEGRAGRCRAGLGAREGGQCSFSELSGLGPVFWVQPASFSLCKVVLKFTGTNSSSAVYPLCDLRICHFALLSLSFQICKVGIIIAPVLEVIGGIK